MKFAIVPLLLAPGFALAQTRAALPTPMNVPHPGPKTGQPYAPQAILPGSIVVPLFPPNADKITEPEVYNMSQAVTGRVSSIVSIHNPSIEIHKVEPGINTGAVVILAAGGGHSDPAEPSAARWL